MTITNPSIVLTFLGNDLEAGHYAIQTINQSGIVRPSISFSYQLLNGLKSSSNQVELQLHKDCSAIEDIIATDGDIKATLKDGDTVLFTGYLSTNFSWSVTTAGEKALSITLEDTGTRLLGKAFIASGHHLFNCTASAAISAVCQAAGVSVSSGCLQITGTVTKTVDSSKTCRDILEQMLYELGYAFYFDNLGELRVFRIDCSSVSNLRTLDSSSLKAVGGKALSLSKKIRQYKSARVTFTELATSANHLVYRNTSGQGDGHPYCYMELGAGEYFDGTEIYSTQDWNTAQGDTTRENAIIEACNASGETDEIGSNAIISVSNARQTFTSQGGNAECSIISAGGPYLEILAHNSGNAGSYITRMDAYADVLYEKNTCIVRTSDQALDTSSSDNLLEETLEYVHDKTLAQNHANLLGQYHRYCNSQYGFCSAEDLSLGSVVRINDDTFSGLSVNVMIIAKSASDEGAVFQYTAIGISVFNLDAGTIVRTIASGKGDTLGKSGNGIASISEHYAVSSSNSSTPSSWQTTVPTLTATDRYLWNYETILFTDGTTLDSAKRVIGVYGDKGDTGEKGSDGEAGAKGLTGETGNGIASITEYYLASASASGVTTSTSGWTTTVQSVTAAKKYLWNYTVTSYTNNTSSTSTPLVIGAYGDTGSTGTTGAKGDTGAQGAKGDTGATGNGISTITEHYAVSTSNSTAPSSWQTTVPTLTATNKYLWNYETITYTNGSTLDTSKRVIGVYGDKGNTGSTGSTGATGATGNGISSITEYYLASASASGVTTSTSGWTTAVQSVTATKKYLWNYTVTSYTNNTSSTSTPLIIGAYGDTGATGATGAKGDTGAQGAKGDTGNGISTIAEHYAVSTSNSTVPTSWQTTVPSLTATNKYLWNYETITYTNGGTLDTSKRVIGVYGDKGNTGSTGSTGATGATGNGISSITEYYLASASASGVTTSTSGWTTAVQSVTSTNKYLWNYTVTAFTNGTSSTSTPLIIGAYGDKGATGSTGATGATGAQGAKGDTGATGNGISSISEHYAVSTSNSTAPTSWQTTVPSLTATNKYLWNYETITYTNGGTLDTSKRVIGVYGDKGNTGSTGSTGATGATGNGISSITEYYLASASASGVTTSTSGWTTTVQSVTAAKKYLWNYTVTSFTNNTSSTTAPLIIGAYGDKGATGSTGATGATGAQGAKGDTGAQGPQGAKGDTGAAGAKGDKGDKGDTGSAGAKGDKGDKGDTGAAGTNGTNGKSFLLEATPSVFSRNLRSTGTGTVSLKPTVSGYSSSTVTLSANHATLSSSSVASGSTSTLTIPLTNTYDTITVTMSMSGATSTTASLSVLDVTEYKVYLGSLPAVPANAGTLGKLLDGDYYFNNATGKAMIYESSAWREASPSDPDWGAMSAAMLPDVSRAIQSGVTISQFGFFQAIISKYITAEDIQTKNLRFTNGISSGDNFSVTAEGILTAISAVLQSVKVDGLEATNAKITGILNALGGEISCDKLTCNDANLQGTFTMNGDSSFDHEALTTYKQQNGTAVSTSLSTKDLMSLLDLFNALPEVSGNLRSTGYRSGAITYNGTAYTHYASQRWATTSATASTSTTIGNLASAWAFSPVTVASWLSARGISNYDSSNYVYVKITGNMEGDLDPYINGNKMKSFRDPSNTVLYEGYLMPSDTIGVWSYNPWLFVSKTAGVTIYMETERTACRIISNSGYAKSVYTAGVSGAETIPPDVSATVLTATAPAGADTVQIRLGYFTGSSNCGVRIYKGSTSTTPIATKQDSAQCSMLSFACTKGDVFIVTCFSNGYLAREGDEDSDDSYSRTELRVTAATAAFICSSSTGKGIGLKSDSSYLFLPIYDTEDARRYTAKAISTSAFTLPAKSRFSGESLYNALVSAGISQETEVLVNQSLTHTITVDGTAINIYSLKLLPNIGLAIGNGQGSWSYVYKFGYNNAGFYSTLAAAFTLLSQQKSIKTASIIPKVTNSFTIGDATNKYTGIYVNSVNASAVSASTLSGKLTGSVNDSGTGNVVWGAVFN